MKKLILSLFAILNLVSCKSGQVQDTLENYAESFDGQFIWQGFTHAWRYNHRLNRAASFIHPHDCHGSGTPCATNIEHGASSGEGFDKNEFRDRYVAVLSNTVRFQSVKKSEFFTVIKGRTHTHSFSYSIPLSPKLNFKEKYAVFLNGFDYYFDSTNGGESLKMQIFDLSVGQPVFKPGALDFPVTFRVKMNCTTAECAPANPLYRLDVYFVILGGDSASFSVVEKAPVSNSYTWAEPDGTGEIHIGRGPSPREILSSKTGTVRGTSTQITYDPIARPNLNTSVGEFLGIRSFSTELSGITPRKEAHLLEWNIGIREMTTQIINGGPQRLLDATLDLFFKNWRGGMHGSSDDGRVTLHGSGFSHGDGGQADIRIGYSLVQALNTRNTHCSVSGQIYYVNPGNNPRAKSTFISPVQMLHSTVVDQPLCR